MANPDQFLRVSIAGQILALPLDRILSLLRADNVQYSPARKGPLGWFLNPEEIEIWQLHRLYGVEPPVTAGGSCVQLEGDVPRALLVDEVQGQIEVYPESRVPLLPLAASHQAPLIAEVALVDEQAVPLLNVDALGSVDTGVVARTSWEGPEYQGSEQSRTLGSLGQGFAQSSISAEKALRISIAPDVALALPLSQIRAVGSNVAFVRVPGSSDLVAGVTAWDGEVAYGIDWNQLLGRDHDSAPQGSLRWVVAASRRGHLIVFPASSAMELMDEEISLELVDATEFPYPSVIPAAAAFQDQLLVVPDLDALVALNPQEMG